MLIRLKILLNILDYYSYLNVNTLKECELKAALHGSIEVGSY